MSNKIWKLNGGGMAQFWKVKRGKLQRFPELTPKLHMYHSIQFKDTYMLLQRYYSIGKCVIQLYVYVRFTFSNNVIFPFTSTCE